MFNSSLDNENLLVDNSETKAGNDFIVHNMPEANLFSGQTFSDGVSQTRKVAPSAVSNGAANHQKIGIFIVAGGVILIIVLIYLAYVYMIKPIVQAPVQETKIQTEIVPENKVEEVVVPVQQVATSTEIIATTTDVQVVATTTDDLLPEEKNVVPVFNIVSTIDTDLDGLTDDEEKIIGTNPSQVDTDMDSYSDISELKSAYNPLVAGAKMDDKSLFNRYQIDANASILFSNSWEQTKSDATKTIVFTDADKAFIQVTFQNNEDKLSPSSWFEKEFFGIMPGETINGDGWSGFYSQDNAAAYIFANDLSKIYTITYSPLIANDTNYPFFRLMVKTLVIK